MPMTNKLQVVVADDYADSAESLATVLTLLLPCEVRVCRHGAEALDECTRARPHAVILDLDMPVMSGVAAACRIRCAFDEPPVIYAMTGNPAALKEVISPRSPFARAFIKPVDPGVVAQTIKRACST